MHKFIKKIFNHPKASRNTSNQNSTERMNNIYETILKLRNFEIQNLNTRNNFVFAINAALFSYASNNESKELSILGIVISILQIGMASGAKFWQEAWEIKLSEMEVKLLSTYKQEDSDFNEQEFIHLFSPSNSNNNQNDFYKNLEEEQKNQVRQKVKASNSCNPLNPLINCLICQKFSVSRIPIYFGIVLLCFWVYKIVSPHFN